MSIFDWLGPLNAGHKARGWDALPAVPAAAKSSPAVHTTPFPLAGAGSPLFYPTSMAWPTSVDTGGNSAVYACLHVIASAVAEPELVVYDIRSGDRIALDGTELGRLLARPNAAFSLDAMLSYATSGLHVDGNAYWRKLRAARGNVVELWPVSASRIAPYTAPGSSDLISSYRYTSRDGGRVETIDTADIVHFRYGIDDADHRVGSAPLKRLVREISSDQQATRYADRLLANLAINGLTLSFDKESPPIDQATADELKGRIMAAYGGDNVGATAVLSPGAQLTALGFSPEQMDLRTLHRVPEERIAAVLGVPAIVAGLGAGLDRSTYANVREAREQFTEQKLLPLWALFAAELTLQLVPDFYDDGTTVVDFDTAEIRALAEDANAEATRLQTLVAAGILTTDEARAALGYGPAPENAAQSAPAARSAAARRIVVLDPSPRGTAALRAPAEHKTAEDIAPRLADDRADAEPEWLAEFRRWLRGVERRVLRRLDAGARSAAALVPEIEAEILAEVERPLQLGVLDDVADVVRAELAVAFRIDDPATREYLRVAGQQIGGITETTRAAVADALSAGQAEGEGIPELARRLRAAAAFGDARARMIARTELGAAQNTAALASYRASGVVVGVRVLDGDDDAACAAMHGRTFTLDQAPPALEHPNCTRALAPLVDADDLVQSA